MSQEAIAVLPERLKEAATHEVHNLCFYTIQYIVYSIYIYIYRERERLILYIESISDGSFSLTSACLA